MKIFSGRCLREGKEFEIQGLTWRTISYYYHSGIYAEIYNPADNRRVITKARSVGANYLFVRAFYNCTGDGNLVGNFAQSRQHLREAVRTAHDYGIKIFLTPFLESMEFWPEKRWGLPEEEWTKEVLRWAGFAEENEVELFAPGCEMSLILEASDAAEWFKRILPDIRKVYNGRIAVAEHPCIGRWAVLDDNNAFAGYDCIGMTVFPWKNYGGEIDLRSLEDYKEDVEERARIISILAKKYGVSCTFVATLGMDLWQGAEPNPSIRAKGYEVGLDVLRRFNITGLFLHKWASEPDHLGDSKEVENMLKERWVK